MTAPLPTLRRKTGEVIERDELTYREARGIRKADRILHLADGALGYERALCGKRRDLPLDPHATGQFCVVCLDIYKQKHGAPYPGAR